MTLYIQAGQRPSCYLVLRSSMEKSKITTIIISDAVWVPFSKNKQNSRYTKKNNNTNNNVPPDLSKRMRALKKMRSGASERLDGSSHTVSFLTITKHHPALLEEHEGRCFFSSFFNLAARLSLWGHPLACWAQKFISPTKFQTEDEGKPLKETAKVLRLFFFFWFDKWWRIGVMHFSHWVTIKAPTPWMVDNLCSDL